MADLVVPQLGESITEAVIARWLKQIGERVELDEPVVDLETDKITVQLPAPEAGALTRQDFAEGDTVKVGDVVGAIGAAPAAEAKPKTGAKAKKQPRPQPAQRAVSGGNGAVADGKARQAVAAAPAVTAAAAPRARMPAPAPAPSAEVAEEVEGRPLTPSQRLARREGKRQAVAAVPAAPARAPARAPAPAEVGDREQVVRMSPLRKRIAERLVEAQQASASLTTFNEVDMTAVMALRKQHGEAFLAEHGVKLGFMSFFVKAAVAALVKFPGVNAEVRGDAIVYKKHYDLGIAVGTERGLVVPVLRDADRLGFAEIERGIIELATKARDGKLVIDDLVGGTFTITNGGIYGSMMSTPLLNYPQTGILGMHNIVKRPMVVGDGVEVRPQMYIALTYDHRVVDGREAVQFLIAVKERVEQPDRLLFAI